MPLNYQYTVRLIRVDQKAGPNSGLWVEVTAPNDQTAKLCAQSQYHGYKATGAIRKH